MRRPDAVAAGRNRYGLLDLEPARRTATAAAIGLMLAAGPAAVCAQTQSAPSAPGSLEGQATPAPSTTPPAPATPAAQPDAPAPDLSAQEGATPSAQSLGGQGEVQARDPALPHDLSPLGMFLAADWVVKGVMIGLALASVASWAILVAKTVEIAAAKRRARKALAWLAAARGLSDLADGAGLSGPGAQMVAEAREELTRSETVIDLVPSAGLRERVASRLARVEAGAGKRAAAGTGILATIGRLPLRRPVRHGLGHHEFLHRHQPVADDQIWPWSRPALPRRCWPPRSASSLPFPPW